MKITLIVKDLVVGVVVPKAVWPKLKAIVWQFCETSKYTENKNDEHCYSIALYCLKFNLCEFHAIKYYGFNIKKVLIIRTMLSS